MTGLVWPMTLPGVEPVKGPGSLWGPAGQTCVDECAGVDADAYVDAGGCPYAHTVWSSALVEDQTAPGQLKTGDLIPHAEFLDLQWTEKHYSYSNNKAE